MMTDEKCPHCQKNKSCRKKRRLCLTCYGKLEIRNLYPKRNPGNPPGDMVVRFWSYVEKAGENECWIWTGTINKKGYGRFFSSAKSKPVMILAHRFSYEIHLGEIGRLFVCHSCDNPACVNPNHLFLGTNLDNVKDMISKGRKPKGELVTNSKLTSDLIVSIRKRVAEGESRRAVARSVSVSESTIRGICDGKYWAHVPNPALAAAHPAEFAMGVMA